MLHVRDIIESLSYDELVKSDIIPDVCVNLPTIVNKRYPPFVYQIKDFSSFGMIMDYIVRAGFRIWSNSKIDLGIEPLLSEENVVNVSKYEASNNLNEVLGAVTTLLQSEFTYENMKAYVPTMVNIIKELIDKWKQFGFQETIYYNTEFPYENIFGHPDFVTDSCVLDIKTTASFSKMSKEACLQVLAYYSLIKLNNENIKYIGFILPLQREIVILDVSTWNSNRYLQVLVSNQNNNVMDISSLINYLVLNDNKSGSHIAKGKNIAETLRNYSFYNLPCQNREAIPPCQMFLRNPRTGKCDKNTSKQIVEAAKVIQETGLVYFTHAAYIINLCANSVDEKGDYWQQRILNEDIDYTVAMGGKGVVVHTGAMKHVIEDHALNVMEYMVRNALLHATVECPLLLETPCGEGTEVCTTIQSLGYFFYRFTPEERSKLGVCIDTCHVFVAGYDPLSYLKHWEEYVKIPIKLVHFNDSEGICGCRRDKHAIPGRGKIGMTKMSEISVWCNERGIPMVKE